MENLDNVQKLPTVNQEEADKRYAESVTKQRETAKKIIDNNDFVLIVAYKGTDTEQTPIEFTDMMIMSAKPQLPLLPVLGASSEMLNEQFNKEIDGLKKNFAQAAKTRK